jgi:hypothetical protein
MPTYEYTPTFGKDYALLDPADQQRFRRVVHEAFVPDLAAHRFRLGLRVKGVRGARGVFEMTWAPDGRATFEYGPAQLPGEAHIIWRRIGTHDIFGRP